MTDTAQVCRKRSGSVSAAHRQNTWVMNWLVRTQPCAICGNLLVNVPEGERAWNPRYPAETVTLHHTEGSREVDRWDDFEYVAGMVLCHVKCHRSYHLKAQHAKAGRNTDKAALSKMEQTITAVVSSQKGRQR